MIGQIKTNQCEVYLKRKYRHRISSHWKLVILVSLLGISAILLFALMGSSQSIAQKTLNFNLLFTYLDKEFQLNGLNSKKLYQSIFQPKNNQLSKKKTQNFHKSKEKSRNRLVNIVYQNETQSYHFDNWLYLGEYISFLINRQNKVIQRKIMTENFLQSYQHFNSQTQNYLQNESQQASLNSVNAKIKDLNLLKFSESFSKVVQKEFVLTNDFQKINIIKKIQNILDFIIKQITNFFWHQKSLINKKISENNNVWIIWVLNLNIQDRIHLKQFFKNLLKDNPKDKCIVLSLLPVLSQGYKVINYQPVQRNHFNRLLKQNLNLTRSHIKLISRHYQYSLLSLSEDIQDQENLNLQELMGGSFNYCNLSKIPNEILQKIKNICKGQKIKTQQFFQQEQKIHFYRLGLYKTATQIFWKNKNADKNYEFQTGTSCKEIPVFHQDYFSLIQKLNKNIFKDLFKKFKSIFHSKKVKKSQTRASKKKKERKT